MQSLNFKIDINPPPKLIKKFKDYCDSIPGQNNIFFSAYLDGELIGGTYVELKDKMAVLQCIYVEKKLWHKGIGSKLLEYILTYLKSKHITLLTVGSAKIDWVIKFYEKNGFTIREEKDGYVVMDKSL